MFLNVSKWHSNECCNRHWRLREYIYINCDVGSNWRHFLRRLLSSCKLYVQFEWNLESCVYLVQMDTCVYIQWNVVTDQGDGEASPPPACILVEQNVIYHSNIIFNWRNLFSLTSSALKLTYYTSTNSKHPRERVIPPKPHITRWTGRTVTNPANSGLKYMIYHSAILYTCHWSACIQF